MKIKIVIIITIIFFLISCSTITRQGEKNLNVVKNIILKNLEKEFEKLDNINIKGLIKISGVKEIPNGFIKFNAYGSLKKGNLVLKLSFLNKDITEIIIYNFDDVLFINHIGKQYIEFFLAEIDFSNFIGININPIEICYFFLGKIPFNKNTELMDIKLESGLYVINISDEISKYTIHVNSDYNITKAKIDNQYFGVTSIDSITYIKNSDGSYSTKSVSCSSDNRAKLSLLIDEISYRDDIKIDTPNIQSYKKIGNINELNLKF
jgi:hypothetical protein